MRQPLLLVALLVSPLLAFCQDTSKVLGKLRFGQGQKIEVELQFNSTVAQQVMGQAIDFKIDATADHSYTVTNAPEDNSTLHHDVDRLRFAFDGMGQKMKFDSKEESDLNGRFGAPVKEILSKKYDIVVDPTGLVLMAMPEKVALTAGDNQTALLTTMLRDVTDLVQPPQKGTSSMFRILPDKPVGKRDTWTETIADERGKTDLAYILSEINDSTIVIDYVASSNTVTKTVMMGNDVTTTMNNKTTGKIFLNRSTGLLKEKTFTTEANGTAQTAFGDLPVTSKTIGTVKVK